MSPASSTSNGARSATPSPPRRPPTTGPPSPSSFSVSAAVRPGLPLTRPPPASAPLVQPDPPSAARPGHLQLSRHPLRGRRHLHPVPRLCQVGQREGPLQVRAPPAGVSALFRAFHAQRWPAPLLHRSSHTLQYFAAHVYGSEVGAPGVGCVGEPSAEETSAHSAATTSVSAAAASNTVASATASAGKSCRASSVSSLALWSLETGSDALLATRVPASTDTHAGGELHCV